MSMEGVRPPIGLLVGLMLLFAAACSGADTEGSIEPAPHSPPASAGPERAEFEAIAERLGASLNEYVGRGHLPKLEQFLQRPELTPEQRVALLIDLGWHQLRVGRVDQAVVNLEQATSEAEGLELPEQMKLQMQYTQGLAYLRQAEIQNCILRHNRDCCIFPLKGGGRHTEDEPARLARATFTAFLEHRPQDRTVPWLLNVLSMAVGDYPAAVPEAHRIPPEAFESEYRVERFLDVAPALKVDTFNQCGGVIAEDFDGDGLIDIATSTFDPGGSLTYYRNVGDGRFEDRSVAAGLQGQLGGLNVVGADYDNDHDVDILVLRGAWLRNQGRIRNSLLRNEGGGTFRDVTRAAGLAAPAHPTQAAAWGDFDNDGDLDLYIANESPQEDRRRHPSQLFRNNGDGTFTDVAEAAGVANHGYGKGVTAGDYDNDGDLDIYASNIGPNRLYRNEGEMKFVDVAPELGMTQPDRRSFATWFFDYDNDGWLDLFVAAYDATIGDVAADTIGKPFEATPPRLYRNNGDGTFRDVATEVGLNHAYLPMGANFGDIDNDGWLDIYLSTGDPGYETLMPNVMLRNDAGRRFQNVTTSEGPGHLQKGHGVAFADLDNDGDQDLYHQLGGFFPGDKFHNSLFANPGQGNRSVTVKLRGSSSNAAAVGARLKLVLATPGGPREVHRAVGAVSSFGGSPLRQEIGLGDATSIERLEVVWPTSGTRQLFEDVPMESMIRIVEGRDDYETIEPRSFDLLVGVR